jgi:hypothetical protein
MKALPTDGYYLDLEGKTTGPHTLAELSAFYHARTIDDTTPYTRQGDEQWGTVQDISAGFAKAKPSPKPVARPANLRLRECVDCFTPVSPRAIHCPKCGRMYFSLVNMMVILIRYVLAVIILTFIVIGILILLSVPIMVQGAR